MELVLRQQTDRERLVKQISQQIRKTLNLSEVLDTTVKEVQQFLGADRVLIYRLWDDGTGCAIHETVLPSYPSVLGQTFPEEVFPQQYHQAYSLGKTRTITNVEQTDVESCLADFVKQFGVQAKLVVPIIQENRDGTEASSEAGDRSYLWGLLIAHQCSHPRQWDDWEVELMQQLATQVAIAIQQSEFYTQLQQLNNQLEQRVQQRTTELATANTSLRSEIAERQRQAEQVRLLQSVVVNTNDAVIITEAEPIDRPGPRILYVNEAFTRITGYSPDEVLGKTPRILQGPKTDQVELQRVRSALSNWESVTIEVINYRKDGSEFWNEFSLVPVADPQGWYTYWIAVQRDTSGRKIVENALRQSEGRFRSLIENALDIVMILEPDGTIVYVSPSVRKVLGYAISDLVGQSIHNFIHPDDWSSTHDLGESPLRDRLTCRISEPEIQPPIEFRHRHCDASWRILEAVSQPFVDSTEKLRTIVNARDITERKRLDEIRLALEREKELSELKTRFFAMASHEFRTPLSTALAAAQVLEHSQPTWDNTEKRLRNLHRIQDSVRNMVQLLDDILTINRAETGKLAFNPQPLALEPYCQQFVEEMQLSAGGQPLLQFKCFGMAGLVSLDETLLRSILSNLLSNAIKYSPIDRPIGLTLAFRSNGVTIQVQDQGIGIPLEDQRQLFEPFHRGKNVRTIPGTGLGLVVVKKCVDLHQGTIEITSVVGAGTTCLVTLPMESAIVSSIGTLS